MEIREGNKNEFVAPKTKLGWVILGKRQNTNKNPDNTFSKKFDPKNIVLWCLRKAKTQTFYHKRNNML